MISKIDLDYAYGQMKLSEETSRQCLFAKTGAKFIGYYRFELISRITRHPHKIPGKN